MSEAKPYAELSHTELCINLPYIHPKEKNVEYYNYTVYDCPNTSNSHLGSICSIFYTIKFFSFHKNVFSIAHIAEKLDDIKKYVNDFDVIEESKNSLQGNLEYSNLDLEGTTISILQHIKGHQVQIHT